MKFQFCAYEFWRHLNFKKASSENAVLRYQNIAVLSVRH
nr:MAG TPA: hypothetical protein [Caudoviricetes sp.]